jgi:ribosomal protein L14
MKMLAATFSDSAPRHRLHDDLHDAVVVEQRKKSGDKDDDGKRLEGEVEAARRVLLSQVAEYERRTVVGEIEQPLRSGPKLIEHKLPVRPFDD